ncbi:MAG: phenylalanine--tRNA ligase subunit beta [Clostridia bacterium]|nr:phenylalanine--tRNA ligase subunit beta [Clostridia bacterium]
MKAPLKWLRKYVDINVCPKEFAEAMTMSGSKVEGIEKQGEEVLNVVVGKILTREKHPDADKLQVSMVDVGKEKIQIVTGAQNIEVGDYVPIALDGSSLPGDKKIKKGKLRGVESNGMMCSIQELGYTKYDFPDAEEHGIYILSKNLLTEKYAAGSSDEKELDSKVLGKDIREVLGIDDDIVEFEITPNRPDCLSIVGLAREAAATMGTSFRKPEINVKEAGGNINEQASVEIRDADLCPRYTARLIKNVKIQPSPEWMKESLRAAGIRPINNIVDITNYVMLEMGQPLHAFDFDYLKGRKIIVRRAVEGESIETLDGNMRKLEPGMLVISDAERAVAVAGVMGGGNSEVTENTKSILLESAVFNGTSVRITAKKLGMRTEASSRMEKGLDLNNASNALDRAVQLIAELGAGEVVSGMIDCYPGKVEPRSIKLEYEKINALLGTDVSQEEMIAILRSVEFSVDEATNTVIVPSFREDVEEMADLAEEVARFYGYNNIKPTLLTGKEMTRGIKSFKQRMEESILDTMTANGFSEIYTYSFASPSIFDKINLPLDSELRNAVVVSNPLGTEFSIMRTTTIPDMLTVLSTNYNRRVEEARLFELSRTYSKKAPRKSQIEGKDESALPVEIETLTIGLYGKVDFYDLKGAVESLLAELRVTGYEFIRESENPTFHPGRTAALTINGEKAGVFGEVHPDVLDNFEIGTKAYVAVLEVEKLIGNAGATAQYKHLPKFPAVTRDIAMLVKDEIMVKQIEDIIQQRAGKILEEIKLFDVYKGKQVPEGMKSVAYSIIFRAEDRTLTDEDVNKAMTKILDGLKTGLDAQLREQ